MSEDKDIIGKLVGKRKNIKEGTSFDVKSFGWDKNLLLTVAHPKCGHCHNEIKHVLNKVCPKLKNTACMVIDATKPENKQMAEKLAAGGYPTNWFLFNKGGQQSWQKVEGEMRKDQIKSVLEQLGMEKK